jgi:hypothetical protein
MTSVAEKLKSTAASYLDLADKYGAERVEPCQDRACDDLPTHPVRGLPSASETKFLASGAICARYGVSRRTLARWMVNPPAGFPQSILIQGRHLWEVAKLEAWERSLARTAASTA